MTDKLNCNVQCCIETFVEKYLELSDLKKFGGWTKKNETHKKFVLLRRQIFVIKHFKTTLNIPIQLASYSNWRLFLEAKKLSHIKSVNEMIGLDFFGRFGSFFVKDSHYVTGGRLTEKERFSVSCLQILRFWTVNILRVPCFLLHFVLRSISMVCSRTFDQCVNPFLVIY